MQHKGTVALLATLTALAALAVTTAAPARAQETSAPATSLSNGGRTVSDGARSLSISQAAGLDPAGQTISVSGQGYPTDKGIYVAFCVIPPTNLPPTPCGGGRGDQGGGEGDSSLWVSSNPPVYAVGVPTPYGPDGTFSGTLTIGAALAEGTDCREVRCAVVSRADHTRSSDRSLDLFVPVTFGEIPSPPADPGTPTTTEPPPAPTVPTTVPALDPKQVAPPGTISSDARSITAGAATLRASQVTDLDPEGTEVEVDGSGFDPGRGVFVALCALPDPDPTLAPGASPKPGPCTVGGEGAATWVSSNPPDYGADLAVPYGEGGAFTAELLLRAVIDGEHDCREVGCAIVTRNDDANPDDRTQDLYLPVAFAPTSPDAEVDQAPEQVSSARPSDDGGGGLAPVAVVGAAGVTALGAGAAVVARRRRGRPA